MKTTLETLEQCDDGNNVDGDGCDQNCELEEQCDYVSLGNGGTADQQHNCQQFICENTCTEAMRAAEPS